MSTPKNSAVVKPDDQTTALANAAPPAHLAGKIASDAGKGVSSASEDNIVPLIYVLHPLSKACQRSKPEYIDGAAGGDILMRSSANPLVKGDKGILVQPCFFHKAWVEWMPNRGGFVAQHEERPVDASEHADPKNPNVKKFIRANGNEVVETRYHSVMVYPDDGSAPAPYVIPFSSTGHTVSRQWMFMMNNKQVNGQRAPSWSCLYRLTTKERSNQAGTWFVFDIADAGWVPDEARYELGKRLYEAFASGEKAAEAPQEEAVQGAGGDDDKM
jgi:hypothetical protein